jgi:hypothetical protein
MIVTFGKSFSESLDKISNSIAFKNAKKQSI